MARVMRTFACDDFTVAPSLIKHSILSLPIACDIMADLGSGLSPRAVSRQLSSWMQFEQDTALLKSLLKEAREAQKSAPLGPHASAALRSLGPWEVSDASRSDSPSTCSINLANILLLSSVRYISTRNGFCRSGEFGFNSCPSDRTCDDHFAHTTPLSFLSQ